MLPVVKRAFATGRAGSKRICKVLNTTSRKPILVGILSGILAAAACGAESPKTEAALERKFQALIVSVDPKQKTFRVRHKPTGYETDVAWDDKSLIKLHKTIDVDDLPEGWVLCGFRQLDSGRKTVCRLDRLQPLQE